MEDMFQDSKWKPETSDGSETMFSTIHKVYIYIYINTLKYIYILYIYAYMFIYTIHKVLYDKVYFIN